MFTVFVSKSFTFEWLTFFFKEVSDKNIMGKDSLVLLLSTFEIQYETQAVIHLLTMKPQKSWASYIFFILNSLELLPNCDVLLVHFSLATWIKLLMLCFTYLIFLIKLCLFCLWGSANGQLSSLVLLLPLPSQQNTSETVIIQWWNTKCRNAISLKVNWDFVMPF